MFERDRSRAPLDGWDPYGDRLTRRRRWPWAWITRAVIALTIALVAFGPGLWRLLDHPRQGQATVVARAGTMALPQAPNPPPVDPRSVLPRSAAAIEPAQSWFTSEDYPASAMRRGLTGTVRFRFRIDPDGQVRHCVPITTSGSELLDTTACGVFMLNARYWPARDRAGHQIAQIQTETVRWQIPND